MEPTPAQKVVLQKYLRNHLKYRETYAEFYDHILTALEAKPADCDFNDTAMAIIAEDFGGTQGMGLIEYKYNRSTFTELKKRYLDYAIDNFKFPGIITTAALIILIYFMVQQPWFDLEVFFLNIMVIRFIPGILYMLTRLRSPRIYGAPLRSIKSSFFKWQRAIPVFIFFIAWSFAAPGLFKDQQWMQKAIVPAMAIITALMAIHSLTYYKVYRDDIKTRITTN